MLFPDYEEGNQPRRKVLRMSAGKRAGGCHRRDCLFPSSRAALQEELQTSTQLRYTDDTAMAIGLAESITRRGSLDNRHLGHTFRSNFLREPWRGYASGPPAVFSLVTDLGISYTEAARRLVGGTGSFGILYRSGLLNLTRKTWSHLWTTCHDSINF